MATLTADFSHLNGDTGGGVNDRTVTICSAGTNVKPEIPDYAILNNVTLSFAMRDDKWISTGDCYVYAGSSQWSGKLSIKYNYSTFTVDKNNLSSILSFFNSGAQNVGVCNGNVYLQCHADLSRNFYWKDIKIVFDYTVQTFTLTVNAGTGGTVTGGGTYNNQATATLTATPNAGYEFVKWSDDANAPATRTVTVTGNATYTATFKPITYTVTFKDDDGATLKTETVNYGSTATAPSDPVKPDTAQHKYTFDGWYDANGNKWYPNTAITGDTVYTARFNSTVQRYTVKWYNEDGSVLLETDELVPYGTIPEYNGATPTKAETAAATYEHIGWSIDVNSSGTTELTAVIEAVNYYARFRAINKTYTVVWKNDDGTVLETDTAVAYGAIPDYNGSTPTKDDEQFNYTFLGWSANVEDPPLDDTELPTVTGNITYTAVYEKTPKIFLVIVTMLTDRGDILGEYLTKVTEYGREINIEADEIEGYRFVKWTDGNTDSSRTITVTASVNYEAIYERIPVPIIVNEEQRVTGVYIVPTTQTIVYVVSGEVPAVVANGVTVDDWSFRVSNSVPDNSYPAEKLYINETRVY